jgi:RNA polymerase sigma-70 factor (subfamily 1)
MNDLGEKMSSDTDANETKLVAAYKNGDPEAFRILLDRCRGEIEARVRQRIPARLQRRLSVNDVIQEAQLVAFERRADFAGDQADDLRKWLLGIADMKVRREIQRHEAVGKRDARREVTRDERAATGQFLGSEPSPSQEAIGRELSDIVQQALSRLPADYCEIIRLVRQEGLSHEQAAIRMSRSVEAVRKLHGRALLRLSHILKELSHD